MSASSEKAVYVGPYADQYVSVCGEDWFRSQAYIRLLFFSDRVVVEASSTIWPWDDWVVPVQEVPI